MNGDSNKLNESKNDSNKLKKSKSKIVKVKKNLVSIKSVNQSSKPKGKRKLNVSKGHNVVKKMKTKSV